MSDISDYTGHIEEAPKSLLTQENLLDTSYHGTPFIMSLETEELARLPQSVWTENLFIELEGWGTQGKEPSRPVSEDIIDQLLEPEYIQCLEEFAKIKSDFNTYLGQPLLIRLNQGLLKGSDLPPIIRTQMLAYTKKLAADSEKKLTEIRTEADRQSEPYASDLKLAKRLSVLVAESVISSTPGKKPKRTK